MFHKTAVSSLFLVLLHQAWQDTSPITSSEFDWSSYISFKFNSFFYVLLDEGSGCSSRACWLDGRLRDAPRLCPVTSEWWRLALKQLCDKNEPLRLFKGAKSLLARASLPRGRYEATWPACSPACAYLLVLICLRWCHDTVFLSLTFEGRKQTVRGSLR